MPKGYHLGAIRRQERESYGWTLEEAVKVLNDNFRHSFNAELNLTVAQLRAFEETGDIDYLEGRKHARL